MVLPSCSYPSSDLIGQVQRKGLVIPNSKEERLPAIGKHRVDVVKDVAAVNNDRAVARVTNPLNVFDVTNVISRPDAGNWSAPNGKHPIGYPCCSSIEYGNCRPINKEQRQNHKARVIYDVKILPSDRSDKEE
jgi:hypothetical protein